MCGRAYVSCSERFIDRPQAEQDERTRFYAPWPNVVSTLGDYHIFEVYLTQGYVVHCLYSYDF